MDLLIDVGGADAFHPEVQGVSHPVEHNHPETIVRPPLTVCSRQGESMNTS
jgi:hypothetical protein